MAFNTDAFNANKIKVEVVTFAGSDVYEVEEGMTVAEFKAANNLSGYTIIDEGSNRLGDSVRLTSDMQVFVSRPKQNG